METERGKEVPPELDIRLILDKNSTHKSAAVSTSISHRQAVPGSTRLSVGFG